MSIKFSCTAEQMTQKRELKELAEELRALQQKFTESAKTQRAQERSRLAKYSRQLRKLLTKQVTEIADRKMFLNEEETHRQREALLHATWLSFQKTIVALTPQFLSVLSSGILREHEMQIAAKLLQDTLATCDTKDLVSLVVPQSLNEGELQILTKGIPSSLPVEKNGEFMRDEFQIRLANGRLLFSLQKRQEEILLEAKKFLSQEIRKEAA